MFRLDVASANDWSFKYHESTNQSVNQPINQIELPFDHFVNLLGKKGGTNLVG